MDLQEAMKKQNDVALFLAGKVISTVDKNSNFVFSPASINSVLIMAAATSDNETLKSCIISFLRSSSTDELNDIFRQIASVVLVDGSKRGGPKIAVANGVWREQSLPCSPESKDLFENFFKADFAQVDFRSKSEEVREEVNSWALRHTNGLIKDLLPPGSVTSQTLWIYGNALYFKGAWEDKFDKSMTKHKPFYLVNGKQVHVPFMTNYERQYIEAYNGFKVLRLPYRQGDNDTSRQFSMCIYLPDEKDGLDNLVEKMTCTDGFLDNHIPSWRVSVGQFRIPKFKIEFGFEASSVFNDFALDVSLHQKAMIEIDEEGTEAAAATALSVAPGCIAFMPPPPINSTPRFLDSHIPREKVEVGEFRIPKFKIEFGFEASRFFNDLELNVSLYQKALIEIDEEGTEAAAATALVGADGCSLYMPPPPIDFVADHPFFFLD
ncbi:Serpin domain [Arabidopsis thaliana x Arabidopsis arenosa]|uniref:Serpin domain n=1 Tax=Arabidopsis thaliana x Arabidopsis arenosa TaxID=1240361 RepID=A0A8T2BHS6_9BRAS|nr:Serpin domain [Arabidopsis thaliana x Arabidopsis arenosa]